MGKFEDYTIVGEWTRSANGKYAFCKKGGKTYFMKEMPSPVEPDRKVLPPASYERMRAIFDDRIEDRKRLLEQIRKASKTSEYIVAPVDIFVHERHIYFVSPKVEDRKVGLEEISTRSLGERRVLIERFMESLSALEKYDVIHGDLKHSNVFVIETSAGLEPRIIDFDDSYLVSSPPLPESTIGSPEYYSPELGAYIISEDPALGSRLSCKSDVFAAGIMVHEYLLGERPIPGRYKYPFQIKRDDEILLKIKEADLRDIVKMMLKRDVDSRPKASEVLDRVRGKKPSGRKTGMASKPLTSGAGYRIVHASDGKYYCVADDGSKIEMPEFAAKGMSRNKGIPIVEESSPFVSEVPRASVEEPEKEPEKISRRSMWPFRRSS